MSRPENCPTCGTKLGPAHARSAMQSCTACNQMNPSGFSYCGFCATPMENTEMRAQIAELAAPPGGWPNLTSELVEVRFYLQQGLFDDAYELLSILQKRHPGHPQLSELARRPKVARRVDTGVMALVDSVLAESANLVSKMPRRAAPRHSAPAQGGADRTDVHSVVPEDEPTTARAPRPKTGSQRSARGSGAQPTVETARPASGSHRSTRPSSGSSPRAAAPAEPTPARREPTRIYRAVEPPAGTRTAPQAAPARPSPAAAQRSPSAGTRGEPSSPRAVVQAPAISQPATGRASSAPRAPSAPVSASRPAAPVSASRPTVAASAPARASQAAAPAAAARAQPAVTGRTVISKPPQSGHTVVVDALQVPSPFHEADETQARRGGSRRRRDAEAAPAAAAQPAAAPAEPPAAEPAAAEPKTDQPRRRTTFGEHVLNRLR